MNSSISKKKKKNSQVNKFALTQIHIFFYLVLKQQKCSVWEETEASSADGDEQIKYKIYQIKDNIF